MRYPWGQKQQMAENPDVNLLILQGFRSAAVRKFAGASTLHAKTDPVRGSNCRRQMSPTTANLLARHDDTEGEQNVVDGACGSSGELTEPSADRRYAIIRLPQSTHVPNACSSHLRLNPNSIASPSGVFRTEGGGSLPLSEPRPTPS